MTRLWTICKRGHPLTPENIIIGSDGFKRCKTCREMTKKNYRTLNKEKINQMSRQWAKDHPERMKEIQRRADHKRQPEKTKYRKEKWWIPYIKKLKIEALTHYGNGILACVCCGESILFFLTLDHINGKKNTRDNGKRAWMLMQYLRARNFPPGYQTLCWNCNSGRSINNGICPHKQPILVS